MINPGTTILLVEDDDLLRDAFRMLLEESGYEVIEAGSAADALRQVAAREPAVVVLDLGLPDRSGLDVVRELRADPRLCHLPVVALTGRVGEDERRACMAAGCSLYLPKPVEPSRLLDAIPTLITSGG